MTKKNKKSALQMAASRKLQGLGTPKMTPEQIAHVMLHAEERGEAERITMEDGSWAWQINGPQGQQILKPTQEMLDALDHFATHGHPAH